METGKPKFCESCGKPLVPGSRFCEDCGTAVEPSPQNGPPPPPEPSARVVIPQSVTPSPVPIPEPPPVAKTPHPAKVPAPPPPAPSSAPPPQPVAPTPPPPAAPQGTTASPNLAKIIPILVIAAGLVGIGGGSMLVSRIGHWLSNRTVSQTSTTTPVVPTPAAAPEQTPISTPSTANNAEAAQKMVDAGFTAEQSGDLAAAITNSEQAGNMEGWQTYEGAFFEIGVPPGFTVKPIETNGAINGARIINKEKGVEFQVFSPQWDGEAPFKKAGVGEKIESSEVKKSGKHTAEDITITATDGSYMRFVLSQSFAEAEDGARTNKTFGVKVPDMKTYGTIKTLYLEWKKTLVQFAD